MIVKILSILLCSAFCHSLAEVKTGYFFFTDSEMRRVYNQGGVDVQLCGTQPIYQCIELYGSIEYLRRWGHSEGCHERTSIWALPVSIGLRSTLPIRNLAEIYAGIGPRYFFVHGNNDSCFVPRKIDASGCGGFINTGVLFNLCYGFKLDLFVDASYKQLHFSSSKACTTGHTAQVGGVTVGGGLGTCF